MQVVEEEVLTPLLTVQELVVLEVAVTDQQELDLMEDTEHKTLEVEVAAAAEPGSVILCMLPDTGERYLTSALFDEIPEEMSEEELELFHSV